MSSFCHLVFISSKYILNSIGKRGQSRHTPLLISSSFNSLELDFLNILFCVCVCPLLPLIMYLEYFKISNKACLCILSNAISYSTNNKCVFKLYSRHFSINDLKQNNLLFSTLAFMSPPYQQHVILVVHCIQYLL